MTRIYLDHCATTPLAPEVLAAMQPFLLHQFGNASSIHGFGREAKVAIDEAREKIAAALGALPQEIVFTSGGTESNNTAIFGALTATATPRHAVTSRIEHPSVLAVFRELERRGWRVTCVDPEGTGLIAAETVAAAVQPDTALISIMHANNEVGTLNPLAEIAALAADRGILFHTDAVQTFGKVPLDLRQTPVSLLSLSAHKIYGPKGAGAVFVRRGVKLARLLFGGKQERDRRPGTENVAAIVGLGAATELMLAHQASEHERLHLLAQDFWQQISRRFPRAVLNSFPAPRLPGVLNISFPGSDSLAMVMSLDLQGIAVSNGSACSSGSVEPSHVLRAMRVGEARANSALRFSLGRATTAAELEVTLQALETIMARRTGPRARQNLEAA